MRIEVNTPNSVAMGVPVVVWVGTLTLATHAAAVDAPYRGSSMLPLAKPATVHPGEARHTPRVTVQETQRSNRDGSTLSVATATTASPLTPIVLIPGFPACQIDFNMPPGTKLPPSYAQCRTTTNGWETLSPPPTNVTLDQVGAERAASSCVLIFCVRGSAFSLLGSLFVACSASCMTANFL
jgi:hypothetical protein